MIIGIFLYLNVITNGAGACVTKVMSLQMNRFSSGQHYSKVNINCLLSISKITNFHHVLCDKNIYN